MIALYHEMDRVHVRFFRDGIILNNKEDNSNSTKV